MSSVRAPARRGFSLIELLIVIAIIMILASISAVKFNKVQMITRETAAVQQIRTIHTAQLQYATQFQRYAATLAELGPPSSGAAGSQAADLIPKSLSEGHVNGYVFTLQPAPAATRSAPLPKRLTTQAGGPSSPTKPRSSIIGGRRNRPLPTTRKSASPKRHGPGARHMISTELIRTGQPCRKPNTARASEASR